METSKHFVHIHTHAQALEQLSVSSADSDAACTSKPSHYCAHPPALASRERQRRQPLTSLLRRRDLKIASSHLQSDVATDYLRLSILCAVCGRRRWREGNATEPDSRGVRKVGWRIKWRRPMKSWTSWAQKRRGESPSLSVASHLLWEVSEKYICAYMYSVCTSAICELICCLMAYWFIVN